MPTLSLEAELAADLIRRYGLSTGDLVVEVGSGDGTFLKSLQPFGVRVLGIESSIRAMARAWSDGVDTIAAQFGLPTADYVRTRYGAAKLLIARSVQPGSEDFAALIAAGARCLTPDGAIAILGTGVNAMVEVRPDSTLRRAA